MTLLLWLFLLTLAFSSVIDIAVEVWDVFHQ